MLMYHGVDTVFFKLDGRYRGRYELPEPKNIFLRIRQFQLLDDIEFGLEFSRRIVDGKLRNMITLLQRMKRTRKIQKPGVKAREIKKLLAKVAQADNIDSLRGYEGLGSRYYFSVFGRGLQKDFGFRQRVRRPPTDPLNAVLSLLYTFLFNRVYAAIRINHLDPYPAFLHVPDYGRFSLALDLMEEFRVIIADTLTLSLFNLGVLREKDFIIRQQVEKQEENRITDTNREEIDFSKDPYGFASDGTADIFDLPPQRIADHVNQQDEERRGKLPVHLKPDAFKRVLENFERKLATEFYYQPLERQLTYSEALIEQAAMYRQLVEGKREKYEPLLLK